MPLQIINTDSIGAGIRFTLPSNTTAFVGTGTTVESTDNHAINSVQANVGVVVSSGARVHGAASGIYLGDVATANKSVLIEAGGVVSSGNWGIRIAGNNLRVENHGQISGGSIAVVAEPGAAGNVGNIINTGQMIGAYGIYVNDGASGSTLNINNTGLIWGDSYSVYNPFSSSLNLTNRGELRGIVITGSAADLLDNVGGTIKGDIYMLDGNDTLRPGMKVEVAIGGNSNDLLDFTNSGTVRVSLTTPASNTGAAAGDTYTEFENIRGSAAGSDSLTGDALANTLQGQGGNDTLNGMDLADSLEGGAGNDRLDGGTGADTMLGGAGNDLYIVDAATDKVFETTTAVSATNAGGTDTVQSAVSFNLDAAAGVRFVERLTLTGAGNTSATGNALANILTGNGGNNAMSGGLGNDTINGGVGTDTLNGGLGNDRLTGGSGTDYFVFNTALSSANIDRITNFFCRH